MRRLHAKLLRLRLSFTRDPQIRNQLEIRIASLVGDI